MTSRRSHRHQMAEWEARRSYAMTLKERGYSYAEIGAKLNPPVSRQRAAQMCDPEYNRKRKKSSR